MNTAKAALYIIMTLLAVVIFFALTGMNVRDPMPAVARMIDWSVRLNQTVSARIQGFFTRIRVRIFGSSAPNLPQAQSSGQVISPLQRLGRAIGNFFRNLFSGIQEGPREELVDPLDQ
jgi:hypothetical protein